MKRQTGHPDTEALANFRAGLVGGIHGKRIAAHIARCDRCAQFSDQLSTVTSILASIPAPSMPDAVELRIGAAIAAEAAARRVASLEPASQARSAANGSTAGDSPRTAPHRAPGAAGRRLRLSRIQIMVPVAACLLLAGLGYLLSMPGASRPPSSAGPASASRSSSVPGNASVNRRPGGDAISPTSAIGSAGSRNSAAFLVTVSAIQYRKSTLRAQVVSQLTIHALAPGVTPAPAITSPPGSSNEGKNSPSAQQGAGGASPTNMLIAPSNSLVGCVKHLTGRVPPALVQEATYQAKPAYVIAVPDRAWVVGLDCSATKLTLITTVSLASGG